MIGLRITSIVRVELIALGGICTFLSWFGDHKFSLCDTIFLGHKFKHHVVYMCSYYKPFHKCVVKTPE